MIARQITYFGQQAVVVCDAKCGKAWGFRNRPRVEFGDDPDDIAYLADDELGDAPADPGDYEGGHAKPTRPDERLNKWCVRACERLEMSKPGKANETIAARDFSRRVFNQPWKHEAPTPAINREEADRG